MSITAGAVARISNGETSFNPILTVGNVKAISNNSRYRFVLSDGKQSISAMLAQALNHLVEDGELTDGATVRLDEFITNSIQNQMIVVVIKLQVVGAGSGSAPVAVESKPAPTPAPVHSTPSPSPYANPNASYASSNAHSVYNSAPAASAYPPAAPVTNPYAANSYAAAASGNASGPTAATHIDPNRCIPLSGLSPYTARWTVKARITSKSEIRSWSKNGSEGTLFSIELLDQEGYTIKGVFFKDACDKFYSQLSEGKVYYFSGGKVKQPVNSKFNSTKSAYEITFDSRSEIKECYDTNDIKTQAFKFVKIAAISTMEPNNVIDVLAVVKHAGDAQEIVSAKQGNKVLTKRDLTLIDDSNTEIRLTLWGEKATTDSSTWAGNPIIAFKSIKIGDFGGRSLTAQSSTTITQSPDVPEAFKLYQWLQGFSDGNPTGQSLSAGGSIDKNAPEPFDRRKSIASIKDENMGMTEKADFINIKGAVTYIKHESDPWYTACPTEGCNKKVIETVSNRWSCEKCNKSFDECARRFTLSVTLADHTGQAWFSMFNDTAEKILGATAQQLYEMKVSGGQEEQYEKVYADALFKDYVFKVKVKAENVQDEMRVKNTIIRCDAVNYVQECKDLIAAINLY